MLSSLDFQECLWLQEGRREGEGVEQPRGRGHEAGRPAGLPGHGT